MLKTLFLCLLFATFTKTYEESTDQSSSITRITYFVEQVPPDDDPTGMSTQESPPTVHPGVNTEQSIIDEIEEKLKCMITPQENHAESRCRTRNVSPPNYGNPVENFEENIAASAAALLIENNVNQKVAVGTEGTDMKLVPRTKELLGSGHEVVRIELGKEKNCDGCDAVELDKRDFNKTRGKAVIVSAALRKEALINKGVFNASLSYESNTETETYYDLENFIDDSTCVISVSVFHRTENGKLERENVSASTVFDIRKDYSEARTVQQYPGRKLIEVTRQCVYFDNDRRWSKTGCETFIMRSSVRCECNHTTSFAVMVSLKSFKMPEWEEIFLLIAEIIGVLFLFLTFCMLLWLRKSLKKDRILIQINLTLALLLMHVSMLISGSVASFQGLCVFITFMSHFFMMSSALWMVNDGLVLYKKTGSSALTFDIHKLKLRLILLGWLLPGVYTSICLGVGLGFEKYIDTTIAYEATLERTNTTLDDAKYDTCWLGTKSRMVLAALIPLAACICLVVYFLIRVSIVVWRMNKQAQYMMPSDLKKKHEALKSTTRAVALLAPTLGVPWILAFLVNVQGADIIFAAVHGITNGLQGVVFFLVYFVADHDARNSMKRRIFNNTYNSAPRDSILSSLSTKSNRKILDPKQFNRTFSQDSTLQVIERLNETKGRSERDKSVSDTLNSF